MGMWWNASKSRLVLLDVLSHLGRWFHGKRFQFKKFVYLRQINDKPELRCHLAGFERLRPQEHTIKHHSRVFGYHLNSAFSSSCCTSLASATCLTDPRAYIDSRKSGQSLRSSLSVLWRPTFEKGNLYPLRNHEYTRLGVPISFHFFQKRQSLPPTGEGFCLSKLRCRLFTCSGQSLAGSNGTPVSGTGGVTEFQQKEENQKCPTFTSLSSQALRSCARVVACCHTGADFGFFCTFVQ